MKYIKLFTWVGLLFVGLTSSSCFDILEEYYLNNDGSGSAKMVIDVSEMMELMESFASELDSAGDGEDAGLDEMFEDNNAVQMLERLPGIRNVQSLNNKEEGLVGYSYEFANLEALNNALIAVAEDNDLMGAMGLGGETGETSEENMFVMKGKKFMRSFKLTSAEDDEMNDEEEEQYKEMAAMMFANNHYTIRYHFEREVKKVKKNDHAIIGGDGRSVVVQVPLSEMLDGDTDFSVQAKMK